MSHYFFVKKNFKGYINHRYFNFLFELPSLKMSLIFSYLSSIKSLVTLEKFGIIMAELMKYINTSITIPLRRDLTRVRLDT